MLPLSFALQATGYGTRLLDYPSTRYSIERLTEEYLGRYIQSLNHEEVLHFVAHSLGAIMLRYYLENHKVENIGRIVMLAPGNAGSPSLSLYRRHPLFSVFLGPAGVQSADDRCFACTLTDERLPETGIISGCVAFDPASYFSMEWPHDGKTTVQGTKLKGMKDHVVLPASHELMMFDPIAIYQTINFLRHGYFKHVIRE
jgi:pimeloyl-ACP methyl ester carboxylesterase